MSVRHNLSTSKTGLYSSCIIPRYSAWMYCSVFSWFYALLLFILQVLSTWVSWLKSIFLF